MIEVVCEICGKTFEDEEVWYWDSRDIFPLICEECYQKDRPKGVVS